MRNRWRWFWFLFVVAAAGLALAIWYFIEQKKLGQLDAAQALPENYLVAFCGSDIIEVAGQFKTSQFYASVAHYQKVQAAWQVLGKIDSLQKRDKVFRSVTLQRPYLLSLQPIGDGDVDILAVLDIGIYAGRNKVEDYLGQLFPDSRVFDRKYRDQLVQGVYKGKQGLIHLTYLNNLLVLSANPLLVENLIDSYLDGKFPSRVFPAQEEGERQQFAINHKAIAQLAASYHHPQLREVFPLLVPDEVSTVLQFDFGRKQIHGSGVFRKQGKDTLAAEPVLPFLKLLPPKTAFAAMVPANAVNRTTEKATAAELDYSPAQLAEMASNGAVYLLLQSDYDPQLFEEGFIMVPRRPLTTKSLQQEMRQIANNPDYIFLPTLHRNIEVFRFSKPHFLTPVLGSAFAHFDSCYYALVNNHVLLAQSQPALFQMIDQMVAPAPVSLTGLPNLAAQGFYFDFHRLPPYLAKRVRQNFQDEHQANAALYQAVGKVAWQATLARDSAPAAMVIAGESIAQASEKRWEAALGAPVVMLKTVALPWNNQQMIVAQNAQNRLFLINAQGKIVWHRDLVGPVCGDVYITDFYQNQRVNLLVASENIIYLISEDGKDAGGYPLRIGRKCNTGLTLVEQHGRAAYYFIGAEDHNIYGFNMDGTPLAGWKPKSLNTDVSGKVLAFEYLNQLYVSALSQKGIIYLWTLDGTQARQHLNAETVPTGRPYVEFGRVFEELQYLFLDTAGKVHVLRLDGAHSVSTPAEGIQWKAMLHLDTDSNGRKEVVLFTQQKAEAIEGTTVWRVGLPTGRNFQPDIFWMYRKPMLVYFDNDLKKVYLASRAGTVHPGLPVSGEGKAVVADLSGDRRFQLITIHKNANLVCYRIAPPQN